MRTSPLVFAPLTPATYYILAALRARALHAYALCQQVTLDSQGCVILSTGSMHHALTNLVKRGLIIPAESTSSGRIRYQLSTVGLKEFNQELARLKHAITIGELAKRGLFTTSMF